MYVIILVSAAFKPDASVVLPVLHGHLDSPQFTGYRIEGGEAIGEGYIQTLRQYLWLK